MATFNVLYEFFFFAVITNFCVFNFKSKKKSPSSLDETHVYDILFLIYEFTCHFLHFIHLFFYVYDILIVLSLETWRVQAEKAD